MGRGLRDRSGQGHAPVSVVRQGALVIAYPFVLVVSQIALLLAAAAVVSPPYTSAIGWPLLGAVLVMALAAAFGAMLLALLLRDSLPPGWRRIILGWTAIICILAVVWAFAMPPGIFLEALLVKPGGVWLIASAGALGFWQMARTQTTRKSGPSI